MPFQSPVLTLIAHAEVDGSRVDLCSTELVVRYRSVAGDPNAVPVIECIERVDRLRKLDLAPWTIEVLQKTPVPDETVHDYLMKLKFNGNGFALAAMAAAEGTTKRELYNAFLDHARICINVSMGEVPLDEGVTPPDPPKDYKLVTELVLDLCYLLPKPAPLESGD